MNRSSRQAMCKRVRGVGEGRKKESRDSYVFRDFSFFGTNTSKLFRTQNLFFCEMSTPILLFRRLNRRLGSATTVCLTFTPNGSTHPDGNTSLKTRFTVRGLRALEFAPIPRLLFLEEIDARGSRSHVYVGSARSYFALKFLGIMMGRHGLFILVRHNVLVLLRHSHAPVSACL